MTDLYCIHHGGANASWAAIVVGCLIGLATGWAWGALQGFLVAKAQGPAADRHAGRVHRGRRGRRAT